MMYRRSLFGLISSVGVIRNACPETFPVQSIQLIAEGPMNRNPDVIPSLLSECLGTTLGQRVNVSHRPGGVALDDLTHSKADGYTIGLITTSDLIFSRFLRPPSRSEPIGRIAPIMTVGISSFGLATHSLYKSLSLADVTAFSKDLRRGIRIATGPVGSPSHLTALKIVDSTGMKATVRPVDSERAALVSVIDMVDDAVVADVPFLLRYKKSSIKFLVVTGPVREESLPNVQTIQEAGFPQAEIEVWIGVVAPLATPASILELLNTKLRESCNASDIRNRLSNLGYRATISTVQDFHTLIYRDLDRWTRINQEMRIPTVDQQK